MAQMPFVYDDGGRKESGRKGNAGDCVCRAIAIASRRPYEAIYGSLAAGTGAERTTKGRPRGRTARSGIHTSRKWFKDFMRALGFQWVPCMAIGSGCKVHLSTGELPVGRLVVAVSGHYTAVIDGTIHDTYDPQREMAIFRQFPGWQDAQLKPGEQRNQNGIFTVARRCVYGYWKLQEAVNA